MSLGLQTARALVIDNDYGEAKGVLLALAKLRIGSVYLNGDLELVDNEDDRFRGIRLAFVDMDLIGDGNAAPEEYGAQAAEYLAKAVSQDNGMLAVFIWTKHTEASDQFFSELKKHLPNCSILHIGTMEKPRAADTDDPEAVNDAVEEIVRIITEKLDDSIGVRLLWEWEQLIHEAATKTSENLIGVVLSGQKPDERDLADMSSGLTRALGVLAAAARERRPDTGIEAASHSFLALLPVLQDGSEQASDSFRAIPEDKLADLLRVATDVGTAKDRSADRRTRFGRLNRMIHVARRYENDQPLLPGNVYVLDDAMQEGLDFDGNSLLLGVVGPNYQKDADGPDPVLILAEVSPACDYAQGKVDTPRVLAGALVPTSKLKNPPGDLFLYKQCGVFHFDDDEVEGLTGGTYHLVLNARFFAGLSSRKIQQRTPLFRIRQTTLVDIQAWLARHGNRPGVITVTS